MFDVNIKSGKHILSGINYYMGDAGGWLKDAQGVCFILDGKHYYAVEDPSDGYRSMMVLAEADKKICKRTFPPQEVKVVHENTVNNYHTATEVFHIYNPNDNSLILKVETQNYDDYYPMAVYEYHPENLPINK